MLLQHAQTQHATLIRYHVLSCTRKTGESNTLWGAHLGQATLQEAAAPAPAPAAAAVAARAAAACLTRHNHDREARRGCQLAQRARQAPTRVRPSRMWQVIHHHQLRAGCSSALL